MSTLWVFGNSFSDQGPGKNTWMKQVADNLQYTAQYHSLGGTSLDYVYKTFNDCRSQIRPNDVLILTMTDTNRRWLYKDEPENAIWTATGSEEVDLYLECLDQLQIHELYLQNFLYNINNFAKNNIHTILLPCFRGISDFLNSVARNYEHLHIANRSIIEVSKEEWEPGEFYASGIMRNTLDCRANHLTTSNHNIMRDKLLNNIHNKEPIVLSGFRTNFVNTKRLYDPEFITHETYGTQPYK